jgi:hypothetical protein
MAKCIVYAFPIEHSLKRCPEISHTYILTQVSKQAANKYPDNEARENRRNLEVAAKYDVGDHEQRHSEHRPAIGAVEESPETWPTLFAVSAVCAQDLVPKLPGAHESFTF